MTTPKLDGLTSTTVTGILYNQGIQASRDRIARVSDILFGTSVRRDPMGQRRFGDTQVELLAAALTALDDGEIDLAVVERSMADHAGDPVTRFRAAVKDITRRRLAAATDAAARFDAICSERERMTA